jgi:hypothetical protein
MTDNTIILTVANAADAKKAVKLVTDRGARVRHHIDDVMSDGTWGGGGSPPLWTLGGLGLSVGLAAVGLAVSPPLSVALGGVVMDLLTGGKGKGEPPPYPVCTVLVMELQNQRREWLEHTLLRAGYTPSNGLADVRNAVWAARHDGPPPAWKDTPKRKRVARKARKAR